MHVSWSGQISVQDIIAAGGNIHDSSPGTVAWVLFDRAALPAIVAAHAELSTHHCAKDPITFCAQMILVRKYSSCVVGKTAEVRRCVRA